MLPVVARDRHEIFGAKGMLAEWRSKILGPVCWSRLDNQYSGLPRIMLHVRCMLLHASLAVQQLHAALVLSQAEKATSSLS